MSTIRIQNGGLKCAAGGSLQIQDAKKLPKIAIWHHRTTSTGYIFATKARIDNRKNMLSSNTCSTCPYNMVNFGPLMAEILSLVQGTPANFNGFRVLAALLHGIQQGTSAKLCGVEQRAPPMFGRATITLGAHILVFSLFWRCTQVFAMNAWCCEEVKY